MASGPSAPPYTIHNESLTGVPVAPPIGSPIGGTRMPQPSPYPTQPPPPYNNATIDVTQGANSSTAQPQIVYVVSKNNSEGIDCCKYFCRIIIFVVTLLIAGIIMAATLPSRSQRNHT